MVKSASGRKGGAEEEDVTNIAEGECVVSLHAGYETNGIYMDAFLARPADGPPRPGMVLLSGMGGLTWTQREITTCTLGPGSSRSRPTT